MLCKGVQGRAYPQSIRESNRNSKIVVIAQNRLSFLNTNIRHKVLKREVSHPRTVPGQQDFTLSFNQHTLFLSQLKATFRSNLVHFYLHKS